MKISQQMINRSTLLLSFFCTFLLTCTAPAYSKVYRISQSEISFEKQLTTILNEIESIPGNERVKIIIDKGYYSISNTIDINIKNHPVDIIGSKNNKTIISGSIRVEGWEILPNGLWRGKVPKHENAEYLPDQLFVNGIRAIRSRIPKDGVLLLQSATKEGSLYGAKLKKDDMERIPFIGNDEIPILTIYRKWNASKRYLQMVSSNDTALYFTGIEFPSYNLLAAGNGVVIENTIKGIDIPGEWCVDKNGFIYYLPKESENINDTEFRIPIVERLFTVQSTSSLSFKNIVFEHTFCQLPPRGWEYAQAAYGMSAAIEVDNTNGLSIENCEIRNVANYGVWLRQHCSESNISDSYFHDLGAGAIKIGVFNSVDLKELTNHTVIDNNIINHYGQLMECAVGIILFKASDCKIVHNDLHYGNYTGISLGWVWGYGDSPTKNNEVAYNRISHIGDRRLNDLGGIYTLGKSEGTIIHHNVISDIVASNLKGWGIYADEGTTGVLIEKNVIYRCAYSGFHQNYGSNNIVKNNIFAWGKQSQMSMASTNGEYPLVCKNNIIIMETGSLFSGSAVNSDKFVVDSNCYWSISNELPKVGNEDVLTWINRRDSTSVYLDPNFRDPQNADFRFNNKSICKIIGFEPFDYSKAGVYGKRKWKKKAAIIIKD